MNLVKFSVLFLAQVCLDLDFEDLRGHIIHYTFIQCLCQIISDILYNGLFRVDLFRLQRLTHPSEDQTFDGSFLGSYIVYAS